MGRELGFMYYIHKETGSREGQEKLRISGKGTVNRDRCISNSALRRLSLTSNVTFGWDVWSTIRGGILDAEEHVTVRKETLFLDHCIHVHAKLAHADNNTKPPSKAHTVSAMLCLTLAHFNVIGHAERHHASLPATSSTQPQIP